jgi:hypothetical protein
MISVWPKKPPKSPQKDLIKSMKSLCMYFMFSGRPALHLKAPHTYSFKSPGARIFSVKISMFLTEKRLQFF